MTQRRPITVTERGVWDPNIGEDDDELTPQAIVATKPSNFVAPIAQSQVVRRQDAPSFDLSGLPALHTSEAVDTSDELQRSKGFVWRVAPLSLGFGAGVAGVVLLAGGNATGAIVALFLCFAVVWAGAFVYHISRSPAGVAYGQSRSLWKVIEREQRYRHSVDWHERTRDR